MAEPQSQPLPQTVTLHHPQQPDLPSEYVVTGQHMQEVMRLVQKVAKFDANVLICGESGTGKELLARLIHQQSRRAQGPFVPVNCGALSGDLFAAKLFGHEAGAFTGATRLAKGRFEEAHQGTLFLDEVSEISLPNQVDFLRVLEDGWFRRIGGQRPIKVDVRVVAATNKDLALEADQGRFRKDLYYRLQVVPIVLPPLRQRRDAIPHLAAHLLARAARQHGKPPVSLSPAALEHISAHPWPGNIRQLKNFLERLFFMASGPVVEPADLPPDFWTELGLEGPPVEDRPELVTDQAPALEPLWRARARVERALILRTLEHTGGDRARAAELLEIKPRTLRQKMSDYEITFQRARRGGAQREDA